MLGETLSGSARAFIVDFGKACKLADGKLYHLSDEQKQVYKRDHRHIAPDLRDGIVKQSFSTDIYSFGRIIKRIDRVILHSEHLVKLVGMTLSYNSTDRPIISHILQSLNNVL